MKTIAVTGVTGSQGGATARALLADGWHVRGLTRNAASPAARRAADLGIELVTGDMGDAAALERLFEGADGVYGVTDFFRNGLIKEVGHGRLIAETARRTGIRHLVFPSVSLAERQTDVPYLNAKWRIEEHIRALQVPATILRPALFMEDLVDRKYAPPVWWGTVRRIVGGDKRLYWVAVADLGAVAATVFAAPGTFIGQAFTVAGDLRSMNEARAVFARVDGTAPLALPVPVWVWRRFINPDLPALWKLLADITLEADIDAVRRIHPGLMDMETWLRGKRQAG